MADNTNRQSQEDALGRGPKRKETSEDPALNDTVRGNASHQKEPADSGRESTLDEKSSGMGRRNKGSGLATKDGLTGSDLDGQLL